MKMFLGLYFGVIVVFAFSAADASAQSGGRGINSREHSQRIRIRNGVQSGDLTRNETARPVREQARIRREEFRFRRFGDGLSDRERLRLQLDLNRASRHIRHQTHDGQDRRRP